MPSIWRKSGKIASVGGSPPPLLSLETDPRPPSTIVPARAVKAAAGEKIPRRVTLCRFSPTARTTKLFLGRMTDHPQEEVRAFIRPRPIRVAFLLADGEHVQLELDGIFSASLAWWGGRYSLICPCENGYPRESYLPWLKALNPDVIYSFIDLTDENDEDQRDVRPCLPCQAQ